MSWLLASIFGGSKDDTSRNDNSGSSSGLSAEEMRARRLARFRQKKEDVRDDDDEEAEVASRENAGAVEASVASKENKLSESDATRTVKEGDIDADDDNDDDDADGKNSKKIITRKVDPPSSSLSVSAAEKSASKKIPLSRGKWKDASRVHSAMSRVLLVRLKGPRDEKNGMDARYAVVSLGASTLEKKKSAPSVSATAPSIVRMDASDASEIIFALLRQKAASGDSNRVLVSYLCGSWCRASCEIREAGRTEAGKPVRNAMRRVQEVIINYSATVLVEPELTGGAVVSKGAIDIFGAFDSIALDAHTGVYASSYLEALFTKLRSSEDDDDDDDDGSGDCGGGDCIVLYWGKEGWFLFLLFRCRSKIGSKRFFSKMRRFARQI